MERLHVQETELICFPRVAPPVATAIMRRDTNCLRRRFQACGRCRGWLRRRRWRGPGGATRPSRIQPMSRTCTAQRGSRQDGRNRGRDGAEPRERPEPSTSTSSLTMPSVRVSSSRCGPTRVRNSSGYLLCRANAVSSCSAGCQVRRCPVTGVTSVNALTGGPGPCPLQSRSRLPDPSAGLQG
jgi:hypothetical protein